MSIYTLGIMSAIIAFLGFILENIWLAFTKGYIDNRNMSMPFLFGYGMAVISIYSVFGLPQDMMLFGRIAVGKHSGALYFTAVFFAVSIGEIVLGYAVEKLCGFEYWNYTRLPLHITKYTSVFTSLGFSVVICLFMRYAFLPLVSLIEGMNTETGRVLAFVLVFIMTADFIISFYRMHKSHSLNERWRITLWRNDDNYDRRKRLTAIKRS